MLRRLDSHSDYMSAQKFKEILADLTGNFDGLSMQLSHQDGIPKVISPIDNCAENRERRCAAQDLARQQFTRTMIHVGGVKSKIEPYNIGYIRVSQFTDRTAADFKRSLQGLKQRATVLDSTESSNEAQSQQ